MWRNQIGPLEGHHCLAVEGWVHKSSAWLYGTYTWMILSGIGWSVLYGTTRQKEITQIWNSSSGNQLGKTSAFIQGYIYIHVYMSFCTWQPGQHVKKCISPPSGCKWKTGGHNTICSEVIPMYTYIPNLNVLPKILLKYCYCVWKEISVAAVAVRCRP